MACLNLLAYSTGWTFIKNPAYAMVVRVVVIAGKFVKYGAFIIAVMLITSRYNVERWTGIAISLVSAHRLYLALKPLFMADCFAHGDGLAFWLQPVIMLIGGAAIWRMGTILRVQDASKPPTSGTLRNAPDNQLA